MREPLEVWIGSDLEEFAAPNGPIETVPGPVPGHAERRPDDFIFRHATQHVCKMMLHRQRWTAQSRGKPSSESGREIVGMRVHRDVPRTDLMELLHIVDNALKGRQGRGRFKVADMLADENVFAVCESHCVLEMCARCKDGRPGLFQADGERCVTARPPKQHFASKGHARDGIIDVAHDATIVH